jgi:hypothetical protein
VGSTSLGLGDTKTIAVEYLNEFTSEDGECKEIYVPIRVRYEEGIVLEDHIYRGRAYRVQALDTRKRTLRKRGAVSLSPAQRLRRHLPEDGDQESFLLSEDTGRRPTTFSRSWSCDVAREVALQLKALRIEFGTKAEVRHVRSLRLTGELPSGHNYDVIFGRGGLYWVVDGTGARSDGLDDLAPIIV